MLVASTISLNFFLTNQAVYGQTLKKTSMIAISTIAINTSDIKVELDNLPSSIQQIYTFGSTIQNRWVAVGKDNSSIKYSNNGIQWTTANSTSLFTDAGYGIAWNGLLWIAVGTGTNGIATSTNGIDWTGLGTSILSIGNGIAWGGNLWVAVGRGASYGIVISPDGVNWQVEGANLSLYGRAVAWNGAMWVVVGGDTGYTTKIAYSNNGITWTEASIATPFPMGTGVAWNGRMWIATGAGFGNDTSIAYSYNGINWTDLGTTFIQEGYCVAWNGVLWAVGGTTVTGKGPICTSLDGLHWTQATLPQGSITTVTGISWNGTMWIAVGFGGTTSSLYSYNGTTWVNGDLTFTTKGNGIAYNFRRPYTVTFNSTTSTIGSVSSSVTFPIRISQNSQFDICSDSYYNNGYTNFSMLVKNQYF